MLFVFALCVIALLLLLVLFEPGLEYKVSAKLPCLDSPTFPYLLSTMIDKPFRPIHGLTVLKNGIAFYPAELAAIRAANVSIHLEAFIFHATPIGHQFLDALAERAQAGVKVRVIVDAIGSFPTPNSFFTKLREAGGAVNWYQPLRLSTLKRYNNRTHRELLLIDGKTAFVGGAGIGAAWDSGFPPRLPWRDTVVRFEGAAVTALQTVFFENWLESSGELLAETALPAPFESQAPVHDSQNIGSFIVGSTPVGGRATRAHILFQILIAAASNEICINSPYFLPDRALRRELIAAVARGVRVTVIVPGKLNNHLLTRYASRRHYGELLEGGVILFEYQPSMIHAKILIADSLWSVVGSTNFDTRSLGLNDEVNLAVKDTVFARVLASHFSQDLTSSHRVSLEEWRTRPLSERLISSLGRLLERQE